MKRNTLTVLFIFATLYSSLPAKARSPQSLLNHHLLSKGSTGVYAVWAQTGEPILSHQADLPLTPASSAKVVTTFCALKELGIDHRFYTYFFTEQAPQKGVIQNLWVQGEGDPSLVSERLWEAVQQLKAADLKKIAGNIYIDDTFFEANGYPGRQENNSRAYNALTSAVSLNFNSVAVHIRPAGKKLNVSVFPETPYLKLKNRLRRGGKRTNVFLKTHLTEDAEVITVAGTYPYGNKPTAFYRSVTRPEQYFGHSLATLLRNSGISFQGKILRQKTGGTFLLYKHPSKPLSHIVRDVNKFSNNFMAEQLTKYLGAKHFGYPGTTAQGTRVLKNCLKEIGVDPSLFVIENGSGLSYRNRISAKALARVLVAGYRDFTIRPDFLASLSVYGIDGTMKERYGQKGMQGVLRAKTGTLSGISSLAGYVPAADGRLIAFAILMNNLKGGAFAAHQLQDSFVHHWKQLTKKQWNES